MDNGRVGIGWFTATFKTGHGDHMMTSSMMCRMGNTKGTHPNDQADASMPACPILR